MKRIQIEYVPIESIRPAAYNPRDISVEELAGLKESVLKFGEVEPIVFNIRTGKIVGGHQRYKVFDALKYKEVPVVKVDLSEIEEKALNLALNNHAIQGKFNPELVHTLLEEIRIDIPDLVKKLRFDVLESDLKIAMPEIISEDFSDKNSEIDTDNFGNDLQHTCPKCGFEFNE